MMNLMHWRLLVAVADSKNVSRAAERYGITQSGASQTYDPNGGKPRVSYV